MTKSTVIVNKCNKKFSSVYLRLCLQYIYIYVYAVAKWYDAGLANARSCVQIQPTAAVYQRQRAITPGSVNEYQ